MNLATPSKIEISALWEQHLADEQKKYEERERIYSLWKKGVSVKTIAKDLGLTLNQVYYAINRYHHPSQQKPLFKCVYPNLRGWLMINNLDLVKLAKIMDICYTSLLRITKGENCTKYVIDKLIALTGMSYEVLFYREDK